MTRAGPTAPDERAAVRDNGESMTDPTPLSETEASEYLAFATRIAREAGKVTLAHYRTGREAAEKADGTPVTIADRNAEQLLRSRITETYPDHAILGEEFGETGGDGATHRWVLDPIDGTVSFVHGVPFYGVLVALEIDGVSRVGVAHFPAAGDTFAAADGLGCRRNGELVRVSDVETLAEATLGYTDARSFAEHDCSVLFTHLQAATRVQRGWGDAYGHCLVAAGQIDLMVEPQVAPWDRAALLPILREAGGYHGAWDGLPHPEGGSALSTNAALRALAIELLHHTH